jgi:hypothetical protein
LVPDIKGRTHIERIFFPKTVEGHKVGENFTVRNQNYQLKDDETAWKSGREDTMHKT